MKKFFIVSLLLAVAALQSQAGVLTKKNINGIQYKCWGGKYTTLYAEAYITDKAPAEIVIPDYVEAKGNKYPVTSVTTWIASNHVTHVRSITLPKTVTKQFFCGCTALKTVIFEEGTTKISYLAFNQCPNLENIVIPNSVNEIGYGAFENCARLKSVTLPDKKWKKYADTGIYGQGDNAIFKNCNNLATVKGNTVDFPTYLIDYASEFSENSVVAQMIKDKKTSFSYYAQEKITNDIKKWQKKKEYETTVQWKNRVTEENQKKEVSKLTEQTKKAYIAKNTPQKAHGTIGTYDADYGVYPITLNGVRNVVYVKLPVSEAKNFKDNWSKVVVQPQYGVVEDHLGVLSCTFKLNGKTYQSARNYSNDSRDDLAINLPPIELNLGSDIATTQPSQQPTVAAIDNSIDTQIPTSSAHNDNTFAVVIGNENYQRVAKVDYAKNDAKTFAAYCQKTLGLPAKNIRAYTDATYGTMMTALRDIAQIAKAYKGNLNVIFYYAGHGIPNETNRNAFLLPVDVDGSQTDLCLSVGKLYEELNALNAKRVVVFMDACFSGAQRGDGMIAAARGVALKAKTDTPQGNMVVFSAATGDQTAYPYKEKGHGMFTYFVLKKLQETNGDASLGDIAAFVSEQVEQQSVVINGKPQTPTISSSTALANSWRNLKLK